jgi:hypothetical protein
MGGQATERARRDVADTPIRPGTVLAGRFTLEDLLDETGAARFWRATDRVLARSVAVHVIDSADPRADALLSAARTSATVTEGHLLRVLDAAAEDGFVYVVNEWASGMSLDRMLDDGPLTPRRAAWVVKEVAEAVTTAHRHGIAHGRLLPENVMVTEAGAVKLIGFVVDAVLRGDGHQLTGTGRTLGEHEADVVNLGALLYAALVGRWPGTAGSVVPPAPLDHGRPLRPRQVRAGIPRPLDAICDRVLSPDPRGGMPIETAHEVFAALSDYVGDPAAAAPSGLEATTVLGAADLAAARDRSAPPPSPEAPDPDPTLLHPGPAAAPEAADAEAPQTRAGGRPDGHADPEATQAGAPVFSDEDSKVGWLSPQTGDRGDARSRRPVPPPPPFEEPEPRPLFAPDLPDGSGRRRPVPDSPARSTGPGTGSLPAVWGPDADRPVDQQPGWDTRDGEPPGRSWLQLAAVIAGCIALVVALVFAFNLGRESGDTPGSEGSPSASGSSTAAAQPVPIAAVSDFDPEQDGEPKEENPELAPLAVDDDPGTAWRTLTYEDNPELGGLKSGVGLLVDLGGTTKVSQVRLRLVGSPTSLQLLAAPAGAPAPTGVDGLRTLRTVNGAGTDVDVKLDQAVSTRYVVVWLTSLPPYSDGYAGQIADVTVRS